MGYTYKKQHVSVGKYNLKCPYKMTPSFITVHNTANKASAHNEALYHNSNNNQVSFHIAIDDIEAIEVVPLDRNAWAAGDGQGKGNRSSLHIEICYSTLGGEKYKQSEENAVQLIAKMLKERKWTIERVKKHQDWSGKFCPHRILEEKRWGSFLQRIEDAMQDKKDYSKNLGYDVKGQGAYRLHTTAYSDEKTAEQAAIHFVKDGFMKYAEAIGDLEWGYRVQSGKYTTQKDAEVAAIKIIDAKLCDYVSIVGRDK